MRWKYLLVPRRYVFPKKRLSTFLRLNFFTHFRQKTLKIFCNASLWCVRVWNILSLMTIKFTTFCIESALGELLGSSEAGEINQNRFLFRDFSRSQITATPFDDDGTAKYYTRKRTKRMYGNLMYNKHLIEIETLIHFFFKQKTKTENKKFLRKMPWKKMCMGAFQWTRRRQWRASQQTGEPGGGISKDSVVVETGEAVDCVWTTGAGKINVTYIFINQIQFVYSWVQMFPQTKY